MALVCQSEELGHRVGLRKETLEMEEDTSDKENTELVFLQWWVDLGNS